MKKERKKERKKEKKKKKKKKKKKEKKKTSWDFKVEQDIVENLHCLIFVF